MNPNFTSGSQDLFSKLTPETDRQLPVAASERDVSMMLAKMSDL